MACSACNGLAPEVTRTIRPCSPRDPWYNKEQDCTIECPCCGGLPEEEHIELVPPGAVVQMKLTWADGTIYPGGYKMGPEEPIVILE